jgi:hypothetical protein
MFGVNLNIENELEPAFVNLKAQIAPQFIL